MLALHTACFPRPWNEAQLRGSLGSAGAFALGVESGGVLTGFVLARTAAGEAEILTLAVHPKQRRHGLGRQLMQAAMAQARGQGAGEMFLEVAVNNEAAIGLYAALGFKKAGKRPAYYGGVENPATDALVMRLGLA